MHFFTSRSRGNPEERTQARQQALSLLKNLDLQASTILQYPPLWRRQLFELPWLPVLTEAPEAALPYE